MYRKRYGRRRPTMKKKINRLMKRVSKIATDREVKSFTQFSTVATSSINTAVFGQLGTAIQAGTAWNERVGREIKPVSLRARFIFNGPTTPAAVAANTVWQPYRVILLQDTIGTTTPLADEVLISGNPPAAGRYDAIYSAYNPDYVCHKGDRKNRFKILADKVGFLAPRISSQRSSSIVKMNISGKRLATVNYSDATSGGARAGKIYYMIFLGVSTTATDNNDVNIYGELNFTDS